MKKLLILAVLFVCCASMINANIKLATIASYSSNDWELSGEVQSDDENVKLPEATKFTLSPGDIKTVYYGEGDAKLESLTFKVPGIEAPVVLTEAQIWKGGEQIGSMALEACVKVGGMIAVTDNPDDPDEPLILGCKTEQGFKDRLKELIEELEDELSEPKTRDE